MGFCLSGGRESSVGTAIRYALYDPWFQLQCWQDKHYPSTFSRILLFTQCKKITWWDEVQCGSSLFEGRLPEQPACCETNFPIGIIAY
jgi:hypothetical protein